MKMLQAFRQILGVAYIESRWIKRQPLWIVQGVIGAIGFIIILFAWGGVEALRRLVVAYIIVGAWGQGLNIVAQVIGWNRIYGEYERLVASPVTLPIYFIGIVLGTSPFLIVNIIPAIVLAIIANVNLTSFLCVLLLAPIALILGSFLSLSIILRIKNPTNISAITNPLYTLTVVLPPVYYPAYILPSIIREIGLLVPTASLVEIGNYLLKPNPNAYYSTIYSIIVTVLWLIVTIYLTVRKMKWGLE